MTPPGENGGRDPERDPRPEETGEQELGEGSRAEDEGDIPGNAGPEDVEEYLGEEGHEDEDLDDEGDHEEGELDQQDELEEIVSADTQEWDGLEAAEGEGDEESDEEEPDEEEPDEEEPDESPTLIASAGGRVKHAGSAITSGFERVSGERIVSGVKGVRRRLRFPLWARFLTAIFIIVGSVGTATAASLIHYLSDIAEALRHDDLGQVDKFLTRVDGGGPQTILILGSDKDPELKDVQKGFKGLSDTTMLLRLDPDRDAIALFSLPRDLKVEIPGLGTDKLNAAYAYGGPQLTLQTVESLLSTPERPFEVNHLVNVDFEGFARAVNSIDCVYVDVDRRYFNSNEGKAPSETYEEIDIQPGYQALCGFDALDYARYRHTDNDVVRAARQQEFLREARAKIPPKKLISDRKELISIFTEHTSSDIDDSQTMLQVLRLFLDSRNKPIKEVHFEGTLGPSFVTATPGQLKTAVDQFLGIEGTPGRTGQSAAPEEPVTPDVAPDQTRGVPATAGGEKKAKASPVADDGSLSSGVNLTRTTYGKQLAQGIRARGAKIPIYYPTRLQVGSEYSQKPRVYKVNGTGEGSPHRGQRAAYKWVFSRPEIGEYYGFMGTRWTDPPILDDPDDERTLHGRDYKFFYDDDRLRIVAWQTDEGSFWLTNTLIESLSNQEMLRVAEGFRELGGTG